MFLFCLFVESAQPAFTCSKLKIETLEQGVKYVQSIKTPKRQSRTKKYFAPCSSVSIGNFEQIIAGWEYPSENELKIRFKLSLKHLVSTMQFSG